MKIYTRIADGSKHEYWYDRSYRAWYAARIDENDDLGEAINDYTREGIERAIDEGHCPKISEVCNA